MGTSSWIPAWEPLPGNLLGNVFPNSVSLGSSATPRTRFPINFSSQARLPGTIPTPGSQEQVPKVPKQGFPGTGFQEKLRIGSQARGFQARFLGTGFQAKFARPGFQARLARSSSQSKGSKNRFPCRVASLPSKVLGNRFWRKVSTNRFPSKVPKDRFASKLRKNRFPSKGSKNRFPRTGSGSKNKFSRMVPSNRLPARFPRTRSQAWFQVAHVPRNSFPRTTCKAKFRRTSSSKVGSKNRIRSKVPKDKFLNKVPKQSYDKQVPEQGPNEQVWSKQAKFPRTGSQERGFLRIGSQEQGSQEQVPQQGSDKQVSSNVSKKSCPGKVPRTLNNRILQSLKNCSKNGTERLKN